MVTGISWENSLLPSTANTLPRTRRKPSIRHSVANELKQLKVPGEVISELLGHKVDSITMNRYGKRYRPEVLLEAIKQLPW